MKIHVIIAICVHKVIICKTGTGNSFWRNLDEKLTFEDFALFIHPLLWAVRKLISGAVT